jgi:hypothetical protein
VLPPELEAVAGARWAAEDWFAEAKNETGLDRYQVRRYRTWYRHITLSMLAHAILAVTARAPRAEPGRPEPFPACGNAVGDPAQRGPDTCGQLFAPPRTYSPPPVITDETGRAMIPLTAAGTRRLFNLHTRVTRPGPSMSTDQTGRRRRRTGLVLQQRVVISGPVGVVRFAGAGLRNGRQRAQHSRLHKDSNDAGRHVTPVRGRRSSGSRFTRSGYGRPRF